MKPIYVSPSLYDLLVTHGVLTPETVKLTETSFWPFHGIRSEAFESYWNLVSSLRMMRIYARIMYHVYATHKMILENDEYPTDVVMQSSAIRTMLDLIKTHGKEGDYMIIMNMEYHIPRHHYIVGIFTFKVRTKGWLRKRYVVEYIRDQLTVY